MSSTESNGHEMVQDDAVQKIIPNLPEERTKESVLPAQTAIAGANSELRPGIAKEYSGWDVYNNEAKKVDEELVKDWTASLNSLLLFVSNIVSGTSRVSHENKAAIFAAVLTVFVVESKKMLEQDPQDVMGNLMIFYVDNVVNGTHRPYSIPELAPTSTALIVNGLLFASLGVSLVAALASVIALQWVADYDAAITRGGSSPEDRTKRRQFRHAGVVSWKMADIIATLPVLLYISVITFLSGLILWMWVIHETIGLVVLVGAATAVLFYAITTLLSVAFISAPFRTPFSRWIYSLIRLPFSVAYLVIRSLRVRPIPSWLRSLHISYVFSHRREDAEVDRTRGLGRDAFVWLANQLSISQDSYERFLLPVSELLKLDEEQVALQEFREAPWFSILDLLGWKYLKRDRNAVINADDIRAFEVLIQCNRIHAMQDIIRPTARTKYITDEADEAYWSQYSVIKRIHWSRHSIFEEPNSLSLLLRDVPLLPEYNPEEIKAVIHLSLWRNSSEKDLKEWDKILNHAISSPRIFEAIVTTFLRFLLAQSPEWHEERESLCIPIFDRLIRHLIDKNIKVSVSTLNSLTMAFERVIVWKEANPRNPSIHYPRFYRQMLAIALR